MYGVKQKPDWVRGRKRADWQQQEGTPTLVCKLLKGATLEHSVGKRDSGTLEKKKKGKECHTSLPSLPLNRPPLTASTRRECWSKEKQQSWSADSSLYSAEQARGRKKEANRRRWELVCVRCTLSSLPGLLPPVLPLAANGLRAVSRLLDPVVVMKPNTATWCVLVCTPATHPVGTSIRQVVVVRFGVPTAQGNIPALILPLTLLAGVIPIERVLIPAWIHCPHPICLNQHLEVVAGALESCQWACRQVAEDVDHDVVWQQQHVLAWFKEALNLESDLQEVMGHVAVEATQRRVWTVIPNTGRIWSRCPLSWAHSHSSTGAIIVGTVQRAHSWPAASPHSFYILLWAPRGLKEEELSRRGIIWWRVSGATNTPTTPSPTWYSETHRFLLHILCTVLAIKHTLVHSTCHYDLHMEACYSLPSHTHSFLLPRGKLLGWVWAAAGLPVWVISIWFGGSSCGGKQQTTGVSRWGADELVEVTGDFLFGPGCCLVTSTTTAHKHTAGPASWLQLRPRVQIWHSESYPNFAVAVAGRWRRGYNARLPSSPTLPFSVLIRRVCSRTSAQMQPILQVLGLKVRDGLGYPAWLLLLLQLLVCLDGRCWLLCLFGGLAIWTVWHKHNRTGIWYCAP